MPPFMPFLLLPGARGVWRNSSLAIILPDGGFSPVMVSLIPR